jgi:hypothetical protein
MDDYSLTSLTESKNEWCARLVSLLTHHIIIGIESIFKEALTICINEKEENKYLMTFQNLLCAIPQWNPSIIEQETKRIETNSGCKYLEDLITCVHIIQLKALTCIRVGQKSKKIDINIPKLDDFIHKVYINVARKVYKNVYLFELNIPPLQIQKNNRELEILVQEGILNTLRESIPVETILKAYMDETVEEDVIEEIKEQIIDEPIVKETPTNATPSLETNNNVNNTNNANDLSNGGSKLSFSDIDYVKDYNNNIVPVSAPKSIDRLEEISELRNQQRREDDDDDNENQKLQITDQHFDLDSLELQTIEEPRLELLPDLLIDNIEVLGDDF